MKQPLTYIMGICFLVQTNLIHSQYSLTPIPPPANFTFNDLWHFTVVRSAADNNTQFYISLRIFDGSNNLKIKSNTATIALPAGSHYFNLSNLASLQPFSTSYHNASLLQQTVSSGGIFPPGIYGLSYTLYGKSADGEFIPLSEDASEAVVETMWPPMLLSPPDGDSIDTQLPLLTWTPAFSSIGTGPVMYTLHLVELLPGQNAYQAIQTNLAHFFQNDIPVTMLPYPPAGQPLDTTKVYAWQVHAGTQGTSLGSSEIWTFTFKKQTPAPKASSAHYYAILKSKPDAAIFLAKDDVLRFRYSDEYVLSSTQQVKFYIYDERMKLKYDFEHCNNCVVTRDQKYYSIKINGGEGGVNLQRNKLYYLEVKNDKNQTWRLKFKRI